MTSSRSRTSRSSSIVLALVAFVAWFALVPSVAEAGRKRVVVFELEGPKAQKFHSDLVKLIKKTHTVVPLDKWNSTAEELDATGTSEKDIKKVAKKLKIDAIVFGKIDKRRDEYLIKLQVRAGATGKLLRNRFDTKSEGPRIDGEASSDLKDELVAAIAGMDKAKSGGDDEEEEEDSGDDEEADEEEEEKPVKKGFSRKPKHTVQEEQDNEEEEGEEEEDPRPKKKHTAKKDKVASSDDEEGEEEEGGEGEEEEGDDENAISDSDEDDGEANPAALSLGERAVDAFLGLSINRRSMSFKYSAALANKPAPYNGVPVAGAYIDGTVYPLAIGHKRKGIAKNFGVTLMYDRVLKIESKANGVTYPTKQSHYAFGLAFRYPIGPKAVIGLRLRYGKQIFTISNVDGMGPGIPNTAYTIIDPALTFAYQAAPKIAIDAKLGFMAVTNTGQIQKPDQYGAATVSGIEGDVGLSYAFAKKAYVRAGFSFETIGYAFKGTGMLADPDGDMMQDVTGARDTYLGGSLAIGLLY